MNDLSVDHSLSTWAWRIGRVLLELAALALSAGYALMLGLFAGFKCDESCTYNTNYGNPTGVSWTEAADSWQWTALALAGLATLGLVATSIVVARLKGAGSVATWLVVGLTIVAAVFPWVLYATG